MYPPITCLCKCSIADKNNMECDEIDIDMEPSVAPNFVKETVVAANVPKGDSMS